MTELLSLELNKWYKLIHTGILQDYQVQKNTQKNARFGDKLSKSSSQESLEQWQCFS